MLKVGNIYDCYIHGQYFDEVEIYGAVGDIAVAFVRGRPYNFVRDTGKCTDNTDIELRPRHAPDMLNIGELVGKLSEAAYNNELSDAEFRNVSRRLINSLIDAL